MMMMMIASKKGVEKKKLNSTPALFSKLNNSNNRRISLQQRTIGLMLVLLVLVYTVIFQSLVGLGEDRDNDINNNGYAAAPSENSSQSNNNNGHAKQQQLQQQQQQQKSKVMFSITDYERYISERALFAEESSSESDDDSLGPTKQQQEEQEQQKQQLKSRAAARAAAAVDATVRQVQQRPPVNGSDNHSGTSPATTTLNSPPPPPPPSLLLKVPFYVYKELLWLDDAIVVQQKNDSTNTNTTTTTPTTTIFPVEEWILHHQEIKHSEDWWFAKSALSHPKRTLDPSEAKLFVVPGLFNTIIHLVMNYNQRKCHRAILCYQDKCGLELLQHANDVLENSLYFQRNHGNDHFLVASHYRSDWYHVRYPNLYNCHVIGMEDRQSNANNRLHLPSTYVGQPCPRAEIKRHDFAFVADIETPSPMFDHRRKMCKWIMNTLQEFNTTTKTTTKNTTTHAAATTTSTNHAMVPFTMPFCGAGPQCPTLAEARYGFHLRGDTNGANRLIDTILSGTVPIFTTARQYQVLPEWIDWRSISMHVNIRKTSKGLFLSNIEKLVQAIHTPEYEKKLQNVLANRDLVDWANSIVPFDQYLYALSCQLWPDEELRRRATSTRGKIISPYSAYLVPRPGHFRQVRKQPGPMPPDRNSTTTNSDNKNNL